MKAIVAIFFALGLLLSSLVSKAQSKSDKMYDAFVNKDGITNFSFSKNMIKTVGIDLDDNDNNQNVTGDLYQVRVMVYNPEKGNMSGSEFTRKAIRHLPKSIYKKYKESFDNENAEIWLFGGKRKFKECHIFTNRNEEDHLRFVVSFYGDFTFNDIDGLKNKGKDFSEKEN